MGLQVIRNYAKLYQRLLSHGQFQVRMLRPHLSMYNAPFTFNNNTCYKCPLSYDIWRNLSSSRPCNEISQTLKGELTSAFKTIELSQLKNAPFPSILYGFGGIVPFIVPPLYFISASFSPFLASSQLFYGATILAFVGGVKWGNALAKNKITSGEIGISTIPSLVAWCALMIPEPLGFVMVSIGLVGALCVDVVSSGYPPWFLAMRTTLTGIAVTSLMTTFIFVLFY